MFYILKYASSLVAIYFKTEYVLCLKCDEGMCDCISVSKCHRINYINKLHKCLRIDYAVMNYKILGANSIYIYINICDISCLKSGCILSKKTYIFMLTVL